mgnify:CR=1 FL=1
MKTAAAFLLGIQVCACSQVEKQGITCHTF